MTAEAPTPAKPALTVEAKEKTVKMFVLVHSLLADGLFPGKQSGNLNEARAFIEVVHGVALKEMEADPKYQEKMKKEKQDGTSQTQAGPTPEAPTPGK